MLVPSFVLKVVMRARQATRAPACGVLARVRMRRNSLQAAIGLMLLCASVVHAEPRARTAKPVGKSRVTRRPTFVLVHGAWADGSSWDRVVPLLAQRGTVISVHLPLTSTA